MGAEPRVISLLPSATEIVAALGRGDALVGRSHECDFPPSVSRLPPCTASKVERGLTAQGIEDRVREIVRQGLSVYEVDAARLRALAPDVVLTQSQCAVCAVTPADLEGALADWIGRPPTLLSLAPAGLADVWGDIRRVGDALGRPAEAEAAVDALRARLDAVAERGRDRPWRPRVAAIEWIDPPMIAGNWTPELIDAAGGEPLLATAGAHSAWLDWNDLLAADPDVIVVIPCGYRLAATLAELPALAARPGWRDIAAVRAGRVYAADGRSLFSRPGPRLADSAETLAAILDAATGAPTQPSQWWRRAGR